MGDEIITVWGKRDCGLWVTALGVLSVKQLNFHILYIPEFDTDKKKSVHIYNIFSSDFVYKSCILA